MSSILQRTERFEDRREIKNVMGKYVTSCLLCREDTLVDTLFCSRDDISVGFFRSSWASSPTRSFTASAPLRRSR